MKLLKLKKTEAGFTLVELMVVLVLVGIVSLTLANFIVTWLDQSNRAQNNSALLLDAENAGDTITNDIKLSGSVDDNNRWPDSNGPGGNQYGWTSGSQILILADAAVDGQGNIIFSDPSKYISLKDNQIYFLSGTTLYRRTLSAGIDNDAAITTCPASVSNSSCPADEVVATGVSNLSFTYYDNNDNIVTPSSARSVQLTLTLTTTFSPESNNVSYTTRMVFRNE